MQAVQTRFLVYKENVPIVNPNNTNPNDNSDSIVTNPDLIGTFFEVIIKDENLENEIDWVSSGVVTPIRN